jgi:hypothetical protein
MKSDYLTDKENSELKLVNFALVSGHKAMDIVMRFYYKIVGTRIINLRATKDRASEKDSDSQALGYEKLIGELLSDLANRKRFRRNFQYRMILEHVNYRQGGAYLDRITELGIVDLGQIKVLAETDLVGSPRRYYYDNLGWVSPTLLRYVSVYSEIEKFVGFDNIQSVVEIGIGYGGQARIIHNLAGVSSYAFYDLPEVQKLADYFLRATSTQLSPRNLNIHKVEHGTFDLVISNYAVSELPAQVQLEYLEKVIAPATHCYMIMNSGASDVTRRSNGKLAQLDFVSRIGGVVVEPEIPLTGPDNYVLVK